MLQTTHQSKSGRVFVPSAQMNRDLSSGDRGGVRWHLGIRMDSWLLSRTSVTVSPTNLIFGEVSSAWACAGGELSQSLPRPRRVPPGCSPRHSNETHLHLRSQDSQHCVRW